MHPSEGRVLTIPIRMHLPSNRLRKPLDGKFPSMVIRMPREGAQSSKRRDIEDHSSSVIFCLSHNLNSPGRHPCSSEKESLHLLVRLFLCCAFGVAREGVAGVVDHHIEVEGITEAVCG